MVIPFSDESKHFAWCLGPPGTPFLPCAPHAHPLPTPWLLPPLGPAQDTPSLPPPCLALSCLLLRSQPNLPSPLSPSPGAPLGPSTSCVTAFVPWSVISPLRPLLGPSSLPSTRAASPAPAGLGRKECHLAAAGSGHSGHHLLQLHLSPRVPPRGSSWPMSPAHRGSVKSRTPQPPPELNESWSHHLPPR